MNFLDSIQICYKKIFNYKGRASKSEYWWFQLYFILISVLIYSLKDQTFSQVLFGLWIFNHLPLLAVGIRRFHDMNKSGWMVALVSCAFYWRFYNFNNACHLGDGTQGEK